MHSVELDYPLSHLPAGGEAETVIPGIRWVRMPLPFALDHINLWMLDDADALVIVDSGFATDETRAHWTRLLAAQQRRISRLIITHCHPDHIGLAAWLAERDGAPVWMTQGEYLGAHALLAQLPGYSVADMLTHFQRHGLDETRCAALEARGNAYRKGVPTLPSAYHRLFDGDTVTIDGHEWRVIVGYGHAPEHASLYCQQLGVLISGDMLLPRISTNVSVFAATPNDDPLGWFLHSLQRIKALPDNTLVLPSHGQPFRGLKARIEQLELHHAERCEALLAVMDVPRHAGELLSTLFARKLDTHQVMFAMGEAIAHLNYLVIRGKVRRLASSDGMIRFERTS